MDPLKLIKKEKILDNEPKEMRPMSEESDEIKKRRLAKYLVSIIKLNESTYINVPAPKLYKLLEVFIADDDVIGLIIHKMGYKTTTVKINEN